MEELVLSVKWNIPQAGAEYKWVLMKGLKEFTSEFLEGIVVNTDRLVVPATKMGKTNGASLQF
jgi:hypothetical protein